MPAGGERSSVQNRIAWNIFNGMRIICRNSACLYACNKVLRMYVFQVPGEILKIQLMNAKRIARRTTFSSCILNLISNV